MCACNSMHVCMYVCVYMRERERESQYGVHVCPFSKSTNLKYELKLLTEAVTL